MKFIKVSSYEPAAEYIAKTIAEKLRSNKKVLWLITGGSSIKAEVITAKILSKENTKNLVVILMDERFGDVGHKDSNWQQIIDAGFSLPGSTTVEIIRGEDRIKTTIRFNEELKKYFAWCDFSIGQFGIGPDGHTAGILPESPYINTRDLAVSYSDNEATSKITEGVYRDKDRITISAAAISMLDEAVVIALNKQPELFARLKKDIEIRIMPAQALKSVKLLTIYNDLEGNIL